MSAFELAVTLATNQVLTSQFLIALVLVTLDQLLTLKHRELNMNYESSIMLNLPENLSDAMKFVEFSKSVIFVILPPHGGLQSFKKSGNLFISLTLKYDF